MLEEPSPENVCAIVVTYFPDSMFGERLARIRNQTAKTIVVDNSGDSNALSLAKNDTDIEIISNEENLGIGTALNQGMSRATQLGYKWAITFDQDSWVNPNLLSALINIYKQQPQLEAVGIIGCNYEDANIHASALKSSTEGPAFLETLTVITSGSLLSIAIFSKAGPFRSDFFIDFVDYEYCLRLRRWGYKVIISRAPLMVHALGAATTINLGGRRAKTSLVLTNRTPLRRYYMTRNALLVVRRYFLFAPMWSLRTLATIVGFALVKIPFETTDRAKKIRATLRGIVDGVRGKTGKTSLRWL